MPKSRCHVMQRAQTLLASGHTITETADLLGFEYPQHFTRMFKKHFALSPSDYRQSLQPKRE